MQVGGWPGILALITFVAGVVLLFNGAPNRGLFDVIVGLNRWAYRVGVYALLMTDVYPPFRYDGGGSEAWVHTPPPPGAPPLEAVPPGAGAVPPPPSAPTDPPRQEQVRS